MIRQVLWKVNHENQSADGGMGSEENGGTE